MMLPYTEVELMASLASLDEAILLQEQVQDSIRKTFSLSQAEANREAAKFHGVSVLDLINSPNYTTLMQSYQESLVLELVKYLESIGYSNLESWAVTFVIFKGIQK